MELNINFFYRLAMNQSINQENMRNIALLLAAAILAISCNQNPKNQSETTSKQPELSPLATEVVQETQRSWIAYKQFAWGHDALKPLTKSHEDRRLWVFSGYGWKNKIPARILG